MSRINKQVEAEYVAKKGFFCPHCKSNNISANKPELMDNGVEASVDCNDCGQTWTEIYRLAGIVETDDSNAPETPKSEIGRC